MLSLPISEKLEQLVFQIENEKNFSTLEPFLDHLAEAVQHIGMTRGSFASKYMSFKQRGNFVASVGQLEQWSRGINLDDKKDEDYLQSIQENIKEASILIMDVLSAIDNEVITIDMRDPLNINTQAAKEREIRNQIAESLRTSSSTSETIDKDFSTRYNL